MTRLLIVLIFSFLSTGHGWADCSSDGPPARKVIMLWNGRNTDPAFDNELKNGIAGLKGTADLKLGAFDPTSALSKDVTINQFPAKLDGLAEMGKAISADYLKYIGGGGKPQDYEVDFFVTNHGSADYYGKPVSYGIYGSGQDKNGAWDLVKESDLSNFAKSLPEGIRFKGVFSQCYSSDTLSNIVNNISPKSCACGASVAKPGLPSKAWGNNNFIGEVVTGAMGKSSNLTAGLLASLKPEMNNMNEMVSTTNIGGFSDDGFYLSSEIVVSEFFQNRDHDKGSDRTPQDLTKVRSISTEYQQIMDQTKNMRNQVVADLLGVKIGSEEFTKKVSEIRLSDQSTNKLIKFDKVRKSEELLNYAWSAEFNEVNDLIKKGDQSGQVEILKAKAEADEKLYFTQQAFLQSHDTIAFKRSPRDRMIARLLERNALDELFLRTAGEKEIEKFINFKKCELQEFAKNPTGPKGLNSQLPADQKEKHFRSTPSDPERGSPVLPSESGVVKH